MVVLQVSVAASTAFQVPRKIRASWSATHARHGYPWQCGEASGRSEPLPEGVEGSGEQRCASQEEDLCHSSVGQGPDSQCTVASGRLTCLSCMVKEVAGKFCGLQLGTPVMARVAKEAHQWSIHPVIIAGSHNSTIRGAKHVHIRTEHQCSWM